MRYVAVRNVALGTSLLLASCLAGCNEQPGPGADEPALPATTAVTTAGQENLKDTDHAKFSEAVVTLKSHYEKIRDGFAAGTPDQAHDPLHKVGHVLEVLPQLVSAADMPQQQQLAVKTAVDRMFEAYGIIDDAMHSGKQADYNAVAKQLDDSMQAIEDVLAKQPENKTP